MLAGNYVPADLTVDQAVAKASEPMAADYPPEYALVIDQERAAGVDYLVTIGTGDEEIRLRRPVKVEVSAGEDMPVVVFAPDIEVGGSGFSLEHAFRDLALTAWLLWKGLTEGEAPLDASAREALSRFRPYVP
jgi:hypothetical protein